MSDESIEDKVIDVIEKARRLKSRAIAARDNKDFTKAVTLIREAEDLLRSELGDQQASRQTLEQQAGPQQPSMRKVEVAEQLGHILGTKGGIYRRWNRYDNSVDAYDEGYHFERWALLHGKENSYTLVQRLVTRAFINPKAARDDIEVRGLPLRRQLIEAGEEVQRQLLEGSRKGDEYAMADIAIVRMLLGDAQWELTLSSFTDADNPCPSAYAVEATLSVVNDFSEALGKTPDAPPDLSQRVASAAKRLEECLKRVKQS